MIQKLKLKYKALAPISQIGETASTGSYFNMVQTAYGKTPIVSANSMRGLLRDLMALHLLESIGAVANDKDEFLALFSGGNTGATLKNDIKKAKEIRRLFPFLSIMGGCFGDMILDGKEKFKVGFLYPICKENEDITEIESSISWHDLINEIEFTRTDDSKKDLLVEKYLKDIESDSTGKASQQMRFSVQYLAIGTEFYQELYINANSLEVGALMQGFQKFKEEPFIGGMSAKGFGKVELSLDLSSYQAEIQAYNDFLNKNKDEIIANLSLLKTSNPDKKESAKNGKQTDETIEDNSEDGGRQVVFE